VPEKTEIKGDYRAERDHYEKSENYEGSLCIARKSAYSYDEEYKPKKSD
jgi:hypothetical protein